MVSPGDQEMVRDDRYTLLRILDPGLHEELYDLVADPFETNDLLQHGGEALPVYGELWRALAQLRGYAWASPYGEGCSGAGMSPVLRALTVPAIGTTFSMHVTGLDDSVTATIGSLGFANDEWLGIQLPWDLTPLGMTACTLLIAPQLTRSLLRAGSVCPWNEVLANEPGLLGIGFFAQAFSLVPEANPAGVLSTNALEALVGS
jgi:hypothetical protein